MMNTISLCIPTKNRATSYLPELIKSIQGQTLPAGWQVEVVICDDGSDAAEKKALYDLLESIRLDFTLVEHTTSAGVAAARNSAVRASTGDLIADLDDDDILLQDSLAKRISAHSDENVLWSFGNAIKVDKNLRYKINKDLTPDWDVFERDTKKTIQGLLGQTIFYWASTRTYCREALFTKHGFIDWDSQFTVAQDLDHWVRLVEQNGPPHHIDSYLVAWREKRHSWGINGKRTGLQHEMIQKIRHKHRSSR